MITSTTWTKVRKRVLGILTAILVAPRLKDWAWDGRGGASACEGFVHAAMDVAERIASIIDNKYGSALKKSTGSAG